MTYLRVLAPAFNRPIFDNETAPDANSKICVTLRTQTRFCVTRTVANDNRFLLVNGDNSS